EGGDRLEAVALGHENVSDEEWRRPLALQVKRFGAVRRFTHRVTGELEAESECETLIGVVVDDDDHASSSSTCLRRSGFTGLTMCASKPASMARRWSSGWPKPVTATR